MDSPGAPHDHVDHIGLYRRLRTGSRRRAAGAEGHDTLAGHDILQQFGAIPTKERVVRYGKVVTAAGVSSGIDMALTLVAEEFGADAAQLIQLLIEYDPQPPLDAGSPDKASSSIVTAAREEFSKLVVMP
jgi:hypothetical protein